MDNAVAIILIKFNKIYSYVTTIVTLHFTIGFKIICASWNTS